MIITRQSHNTRTQTKKDYELRIRATNSDKKDAHSQGDLRENAGFIEAKKQLENLQRFVAELGLERGDLEIVNPAEWADADMMGEPNACVGAMVEIQRQDGRKETFLIGGAWDADLNNPNILPYTSPLAKLLIPHDPGFKGVLETNKETITLLSARVPTKAEIGSIYGTPEKVKKPVEVEMSM